MCGAPLFVARLGLFFFIVVMLFERPEGGIMGKATKVGYEDLKLRSTAVMGMLDSFSGVCMVI